MTYRFRRALPRLVLVCSAVFLCGAPYARAAGTLAITEIMYDPPGTDGSREWVEVHNSGSANLDLAGHFFLTDGLSSAKHSLVAQGPSVIPAGGYAVIVQDVAAFKADYPSYGGSLFDSSWSGLTSNSGKTLAVVDGSGAVLDQVAYDPVIGGTNDGNSLQKNAAGAWTPSAPTPGSALGGSGTAETATDADTVLVPAGTVISAPAAKTAEVPEYMRVELSVPKTGITGIGVPVAAKVFGYSGELRSYGSIRFSFGDGTEQSGKPLESVEHVYRYPGTHVISFEYRDNPYAKNAVVSARATIEIADPAVFIGRVGADGTIAIANEGTAEADLSGWTLAAAGTALFRIPSGTIVLGGKTLLLPESVTGIRLADGITLTLAYPSGAAWTSYSRDAAMPPPAVPVVRVVPAASQPVQPEAAAVATQSEHAASALAANVIAAPKQSRSLLPFVLVVAAVVGAGLYALRRFGFFGAAEAHLEHSEPRAAESSAETAERASAAEVRIVEE